MRFTSLRLFTGVSLPDGYFPQQMGGDGGGAVEEADDEQALYHYGGFSEEEGGGCEKHGSRSQSSKVKPFQIFIVDYPPRPTTASAKAPGTIADLAGSNSVQLMEAIQYRAEIEPSEDILDKGIQSKHDAANLIFDV